MRIRYILVFACVSLLFLNNTPLSAITLKVASTAPQNSDWGRILDSIGSQIRSATDGKVEWRIFHNGIAGSEGDVVRKMRLGQLDIAILTSIGIGSINSSVLTLSAPGLITSADELEYVLNRFGNNLQREINETPYEVLGWAGVGWLHPFSSTPIERPEDLQKIKIAASSDENLTQFYRDLEYNPVPLPFSEWLTALNSGLIEGFFGSPTAAAGFQWFGIANNMVDVQLAPFLGAIIVSDRAWRRIPDEDKPQIRLIIRNHLKELTEQSIALERRSIDTMKRFGLNVIEISKEEKQMWADYYDVDNFIAQGNNREKLEALFDFSLYSSIKSELKNYRARQEQ